MLELLSLDRAIVIFLNSIDIKILDYLMIFVSFIGNFGVIWLFLSLISLIFDKKNGKKVAFFIIISLLVMALLNFTIDSLYYRARPYEAIDNIRVLSNLPNDNSFPSGHAASAFIGAIIFSRFYKKYRVFFCSFAILTAISRVYLAVHYPSDIIFGALEGVIISFSLFFIVKKISHK